MNRLLFLLPLAWLCSCQPERTPAVAVLPERFRYEGEFYPSFMPQCRIQIQAMQGTGQVKLTIAPDLASAAVLASDSFPLTSQEFRQFFASLDTVHLLRLATNTQRPPGTDGVTVYNTVVQDGQKNTFHFWSPGPKMPEHRVVEAVLGVMRRKFRTLPHQEYVEDLEQYFTFPLPCEITRRQPLEVRMHGTIDMRHRQELIQFVNALPADRPFVLDVSNFGQDFGYCYALFKALGQRNARVVWVTSQASCWNDKALREIGIAPQLITHSLRAGRNQAHTLFETAL